MARSKEQVMNSSRSLRCARISTMASVLVLLGMVLALLAAPASAGTRPDSAATTAAVELAASPVPPAPSSAASPPSVPVQQPPTVPVQQPPTAAVAPAAPDPSNGTAILDLGLWVLGGLLLALVLAFWVIARMSRGSADVPAGPSQTAGRTPTA